MEAGFEGGRPPMRETGSIASKLRTPYCAAYLVETRKTMPEHAKEMEAVLEVIDKQALENFNLFTPKDYPGTQISYTVLSVTPDAVRAIAQATGVRQKSQKPHLEVIKREEEPTTREIAFLFTAFGRPPDGNAFTAQDIGIDRFIRYLPKVARAMRTGESVPRIDIFLAGSGTGFGEKVTEKYVKDIEEKGVDVCGKITAEFIESHLPIDPEVLKNTHVLLQGVSMGTTTADKTYFHLPQDIQRRTQRLFDNPAGTHATHRFQYNLAGLHTVGGLIVEGGLRMFGSAAKNLTTAKNELIESFGDDTPLEHSLKKRLEKASIKLLMKGVPLNTDDARSYVRRGVKDLLTINPARNLNILARRGQSIEETPSMKRRTQHPKEYEDIPSYPIQKAKVHIPMSQTGRALEVPTNKWHIFAYENYRRWAQIMKYCQTTPQTPRR